MNGLSFRAIAGIVKVSHKTVYDWIKDFGFEMYKKSKPAVLVVMEPDEMRHFLNSKRGYEKHIIALQVSSSTGKVDELTIML